MAKLSVNIDHVATLREARKGKEPDPISAALLCELAGAHGITVHLREDRRHIQDRDVRILRQVISTTLNLEMAATTEMIQIAQDILPDMVTLVPENRLELTTEGGLDVLANLNAIEKAIQSLHQYQIRVSLFIDPTEEQVKAAKKVNADAIEFHTGNFCNALLKETTPGQWRSELTKLENMTPFAIQLGLEVNMGHGIDYHNIEHLNKIPGISHFSIGHSIVSKAVLVGMERAVSEMVRSLRN